MTELPENVQTGDVQRKKEDLTTTIKSIFLFNLKWCLGICLLFLFTAMVFPKNALWGKDCTLTNLRDYRSSSSSSYNYDYKSDKNIYCGPFSYCSASLGDMGTRDDATVNDYCFSAAFCKTRYCDRSSYTYSSYSKECRCNSCDNDYDRC